MNDLPPLAEYLIARGRAAARFEPALPGTTGQDCSSCARKTYSFPDCCDEGWDRIRSRELEPCRNYTTSGSG